MTTVSPSLTNISVVASRVVIVGPPLTTLEKSASFLVAVIFILIKSLGVTCGVTFRVILASTNSVLVPSDDTVSQGFCAHSGFAPQYYRASQSWDRDNFAPARRFQGGELGIQNAPPILASENPIAPPRPSPTAAGRSSRKFAGGLRRCKPRVGGGRSREPPRTSMRFGNVRSVMWE